MLEILEKVAMTVLGAAAITQKKAEELVAEVQDKCKMSEDEGKQFIDRLQTLAKESRDKIREVAETEVRKVVENLGLVSRVEFERLAKRVLELESKQND